MRLFHTQRLSRKKAGGICHTCDLIPQATASEKAAPPITARVENGEELRADGILTQKPAPSSAHVDDPEYVIALLYSDAGEAVPPQVSTWIPSSGKMNPPVDDPEGAIALIQGQ